MYICEEIDTQTSHMPIKKYTLALIEHSSYYRINRIRYVHYDSNRLPELLRRANKLRQRQQSYWGAFMIMTTIPGTHCVETLLYVNLFP